MLPKCQPKIKNKSHLTSRLSADPRIGVSVRPPYRAGAGRQGVTLGSVIVPALAPWVIAPAVVAEIREHFQPVIFGQGQQVVHNIPNKRLSADLPFVF
jgi:hypothetical protein